MPHQRWRKCLTRLFQPASNAASTFPPVQATSTLYQTAEFLCDAYTFIDHNHIVVGRPHRERRRQRQKADLVILSGAHTIGIARCGIILQRIYNFKGTGQADPAINPAYVQTLRNLCPSNAPGKQINMEMLTPTKIDANYFNDVQAGRGLFESDNALRTTPIGRSLVSVYRVPQVFNAAFVASMRKMASIGVLTGSNGKIRTKCNIA